MDNWTSIKHCAQSNTRQNQGEAFVALSKVVMYLLRWSGRSSRACKHLFLRQLQSWATSNGCARQCMFSVLEVYQMLKWRMQCTGDVFVK